MPQTTLITTQHAHINHHGILAIIQGSLCIKGGGLVV